MEKKKLFLLTLTGGKEVYALLNRTEKSAIIHKDSYASIWIKTISDDFIQSYDVLRIKDVIPFTNKEITKISKTINMEFDEVLEKIKNEEFAQFESVKEFLMEKLSDFSYDDIIETITDLFLPVGYNENLTLEERIQDIFDNVVMFSTSNIVEIL